MQNFQQILAQAAQLKEHQLKKERKGYESLPQFLKSGLGYSKKYNCIRKQHFHYQFRISNKIKEIGNAFFKEDKIDQALSKYEESLSIFRYIQSKSYQNMKDEDLEYFHFDCHQLRIELKEKYQNHLCAIYLNICSCLTKQNKKQDAIFSADQALKIKKTAKGHYKKAQCYLRYVNREISDIKLGLLQLKQAYSIENSQDLLRQMHMVKQNYEKEQQQSKEWFKFMFDKNAKLKQQSQLENQFSEKRQKQVKQIQQIKSCQQNEEEANAKTSFQQLPQKLMTYTNLPQSKWLYFYHKDFLKRNASFIYTTLKIYKFNDLASEFHSMLAKYEQDQSDFEKNQESLQSCIRWLKLHPMEKIKQYIEKYDVEICWIKQNRRKDNSSFQLKHVEKNKINSNQIQENIIKIKETEQVKEIIDSSKNYEEGKSSNEQIKQNSKFGKSKTFPTLRQKMVSSLITYITIGVILILIVICFIFST